MSDAKELMGSSVFELNLKKIDPYELMEMYGRIDGQQWLIKCRLLWGARQQFKSDTLFGQFLRSLAESANIKKVGSQDNVNRMYHAGELSERLRITSLDEIGIGMTAFADIGMVFARSETQAREIIRQVKKKNLSVEDVRAVIRRVTSIAPAAEPEQLEHDREPTGEVRQYVVIDGVAKSVDEELDDESSPQMQAIAMPGHEQQAVEAVMRGLIDDEPERVIIQADAVHNQRFALLRQLAMTDGSTISVEDAKREVELFIEQYDRPNSREFFEITSGAKEVIKVIEHKKAAARYTKR